MSEVVTYPDGHWPTCGCGWVGRKYPLGHLDTARAALAAHQTIHHTSKENES